MGTTATASVNVPKGIFSWGIDAVFVLVVSVVAVVQTRFRRNLIAEKLSMCPKMHVHRLPLLGLKSRLSVRLDSCVTDSASEIIKKNEGHWVLIIADYTTSYSRANTNSIFLFF